MKASIIIPAWNEQDAIVKVIEDVLSQTYPVETEIIVVDDGSTDQTYQRAEKIDGITLIKHTSNTGKAGALDTGFAAASGDILVTIDADCTYPADHLPDLITPIAAGTHQLVIGSRFKGRIDAMPGLNYWGNVCFSTLVTALTFTRITDASTGMRAFTRQLWDSINVRSRGLDWEVEMTTRSIIAGAQVIELPIPYADRVGQSKLHPIKDGYRFLRAILRARFTK